MINIKAFYKSVDLADNETDDDFNRRRYSMEDQVKVMLDAAGSMDTLTSVYRMPLPFIVDPTSLRVRFMGTKDGGRFCHVDLTEKLKLKSQGVQMLDAGRISSKSMGSAEKTKWATLTK
jgi:hypothetical protein